MYVTMFIFDFLERYMSSPIARFRVLSSFVAFHTVVTNKPFLTVPVGSIVETREEFHSPGLFEIRLNDEPLLAFMRDIEECTEPMDLACAVGNG
jgi:hypothetical protein